MIRTYVRPAPLLDVLQEHLEEAAFLYRSRRHCFYDGRFSWADAKDREARLDAHLHGLVVGGRSSAALLVDGLAEPPEGDPGVPFVAAAVLPALGLVEPMERLTEALLGNTPHRQPMVDGLRFAPSEPLAPWLSDYARSAEPVLRSVALQVSPPGTESSLREAMQDADPEVRILAAAAASRRGLGVDSKMLRSALNADPERAPVAARLLLVSGDLGAVDWLRGRLSNPSPAPPAELLNLLAVGGDLEDLGALRALLKAETGLRPAAIGALGLLGSAEGVESILGCLRDPLVPQDFAMAWKALGTFSGIHRPPGFDAEEPDPESDLPRKYESDWRSWWDVSRGTMAPNNKHRCGRPLSPTALYEDLIRTGNTRRDLSFLELQVRYRCPLPFVSEARHADQAAQLDAIRTWATENDSKFPPGAPLFAGRRP